MKSRVKIAVAAGCVLGMCFQNKSYAKEFCSIMEFAAIDRALPEHDAHSSTWLSTPDGQAARLHVYRRNGKLVVISIEYFTDEASLLVRYIYAGKAGMLVVGELPDHHVTSFEFASCPDGSIAPQKSPSSLFTDSEFQEMAKSVVRDFWTNPEIEPYRKELLD